MDLSKKFWEWNNYRIAWQSINTSKSTTNLLLIHGFGASKNHWRFNQNELGKTYNCYSIDLLGFGESSQPIARLEGEVSKPDNIRYSFELWSKQIQYFCEEIIKGPVFLIGNSIGGVIALKSAYELNDLCSGIILIDCAQRTMDDKRLMEQSLFMRFLRPVLKTIVRQRFISNNIFQRAAKPKIIESILKKAYPSRNNLDQDLINLLYQPTQRKNAKEAFRGFINLFDDYLATDLFPKIKKPIFLIWGELDPWESLDEAKKWKTKFNNIKELFVISNSGQCPHDENPSEVNKYILQIIQQTT